MTSAADRPSSGWISTGIPRPLSVTVTEPSGLSVTAPFPGAVAEVHVAPGQTVAAGDQE